jgi:hypothetical protein
MPRFSERRLYTEQSPLPPSNFGGRGRMTNYSRVNKRALSGHGSRGLHDCSQLGVHREFVLSCSGILLAPPQVNRRKDLAISVSGPVFQIWPLPAIKTPPILGLGK